METEFVSVPGQLQDRPAPTVEHCPPRAISSPLAYVCHVSHGHPRRFVKLGRRDRSRKVGWTLVQDPATEFGLKPKLLWLRDAGRAARDDSRCFGSDCPKHLGKTQKSAQA
jgi:hypothetical protein